MCDRAWTFGPARETMRDGVHVGQGYGSEYRCHTGVVYVWGNPQWWYWDDDSSVWRAIGLVVPRHLLQLGQTATIAASHDGVEAIEYRLSVNGAQVGSVKASGISGTFTIPWTPTSFGTHVVTVSSADATREEKAMSITVEVQRPLQAPLNVSVR